MSGVLVEWMRCRDRKGREVGRCGGGEKGKVADSIEEWKRGKQKKKKKWRRMCRCGMEEGGYREEGEKAALNAQG